MNKICSIVVTFNRKKELLRCINALLNQTYKVDSILIVDNCSEDGTYEYLVAEGIFNSCLVNSEELLEVNFLKGICVLYYRTGMNLGGAGGFYTGLKLAFELKKFDAYWLMDDDGYPSATCLEKQVPSIEQYAYVMPVSIDIEDHQKLSWAARKRNGKKTLSYQELKESWGNLMDYVFPFNGSLLNNNIVQDVGYINKDLFIWGDDYEHYWRCKKKGYSPVTVTAAEFYHPSHKMQFVPIFWNKIKVPFSDSKLRMLCLIRNYTYIYWHYDKKIKIIGQFLIYSWLYLITRKFDMKGYEFYLKAVKDGLKSDFTGHIKYLK